LNHAVTAPAKSNEAALEKNRAARACGGVRRRKIIAVNRSADF